MNLSLKTRSFMMLERGTKRLARNILLVKSDRPAHRPWRVCLEYVVDVNTFSVTDGRFLDASRVCLAQRHFPLSPLPFPPPSWAEALCSSSLGIAGLGGEYECAVYNKTFKLDYRETFLKL